MRLFKTLEWLFLATTLITCSNEHVYGELRFLDTEENLDSSELLTRCGRRGCHRRIDPGCLAIEEANTAISAKQSSQEIFVVPRISGTNTGSIPITITTSFLPINIDVASIRIFYEYISLDRSSTVNLILSPTSFTILPDNSGFAVTALLPSQAVQGIASLELFFLLDDNISFLSTPIEFFYINFTPATPFVTGLSVDRGPLTGGTIVNITGVNFDNVTSVTFGGTTASFVVNSPTSITATTPPGTARSLAAVVVTTTTGTSPVLRGDEFFYEPIPSAFVSPPRRTKEVIIPQDRSLETVIITWRAPILGESPVAYEIFTDANLTNLVGTVCGSSRKRFKFETQTRRFFNTSYYIVSVDRLGNISEPVLVETNSIRHH